MIKHYEIKNHIDLSMMTRRITNGLYFALEQYIEQQQKKDELLELYRLERLLQPHTEKYREVREKIERIEEEVK